MLEPAGSAPRQRLLLLSVSSIALPVLWSTLGVAAPQQRGQASWHCLFLTFAEVCRRAAELCTAYAGAHRCP